MQVCIDELIKADKLIYQGTGKGCNGTYDGVVCWEATPANTNVTIPCPTNFVGLFDFSKNLSKLCMPDGTWEGTEENKPAGYTNFRMCYLDSVIAQEENARRNAGIYKIVSRVELVGLILSLLCIFVSLFIFMYHKNLRCKRTKIHLNLFITIMLGSILRLIFFFDSFLYGLYDSDELTSMPSHLMRYHKAICPIMTALLEYIQTCNFMWMLNEGIYLNILLTYSIFDNNRSKVIILFYIIGWGLPAIITASWALTVYKKIGIDDICWSGYYEWSSYWIINAFIITSLIINILCLINVIRILTNKLRDNRDSSEIVQLRKSAKAAILLLPLLGITHIFEVYYGEPSAWTLNLILSVVKAFLVFYQGVFLSILYCFMNNEVKNVIRRHWLSKIKFKPVCCNMRRNFGDKDYSSANGTAAAGATMGANDRLMHQTSNNNIPLSDRITTTGTTNLMSDATCI